MKINGVIERKLAILNDQLMHLQHELKDVLGIIRSAEPYLSMVRFRNFIVHRYEYVLSDICLRWRHVIYLHLSSSDRKSKTHDL